MITLTRSCLAVLLPLVLAVAATGQELPAPASRTIQLDVVVTPKNGAPVGGLQKSDFTVLDNKKPQTITSFHAYAGNQSPVEVTVLIDSVNTSYQDVAYERMQIDKFFRANGGHLAYPVTLAILTDKGIRIEQGFTKDGNVLAASLDKATIGLRILNRSTGFYGASDRLQISLNALRQLAGSEAKEPGRKVILWVSPGWPLLSGPGVQLSGGQEKGIFAEIVSISTGLRQGQVTVDAVNPLGADENVGRAFYYQDFLKGVPKPGDVDLGDLSLQVIAIQSGGRAVSSTGISESLEHCVDDTAPYYRISFEAPPTERRDEYHSLEIRVAKSDLTAHTSTGYYAQP